MVGSTLPDQIVLTKPDDFHVHLRDDDMLKNVVGFTAQQFGRAIVMPNLINPVTTVESAIGYRERILNALPEGLEINPLMTLYLTENTSVDEIEKISESKFVKAVKYYPAGATTNSDSGVSTIDNCIKTLESMQKNKIPLLIHGEVTDQDVDVFDREKVFIDKILLPLRKKIPELKIVFEHITTKDAVDFVLSDGRFTAATITPQHLLYNRNEIFKGGIRPHYYCLPILKREEHRKSLVDVATSGDKKFFLGTDSAPHTKERKESSCGCAGIFAAPLAIELYARVFEENKSLKNLEAFASFNGADFYGLKRNTQKIVLKKTKWTVPESYPGNLIPIHAGLTESWKLQESS